MSKFVYNPSQYLDVIPQEVKSMIMDTLGVDECDIVPDAEWVNDLGCDSLDVVEIIMNFEQMYQISIPDEKAEECITISQAMKLVNSLKHGTW